MPRRVGALDGGEPSGGPAGADQAELPGDLGPPLQQVRTW
jgi:hypothetical protein